MLSGWPEEEDGAGEVEGLREKTRLREAVAYSGH